MSIFKTLLHLVSITLVHFTSFSQVSPDFEPLADSFNVDNPEAVQAINIPYGNVDPTKQLFHMFLPNTDETFPLVILFHGGGFTGGSPGTVFQDAERRETVKYFLDNDIAFMSVGYRLIAQGGPDAEGVIKCLSDAKLGLQFIRHHAEALHIDPEKIALMGSSAGAGTSMWLGFQDDMADPDASDPVLRESTRVAAVFASGSQSTYDLYKWETEIFNNFDGQGTSFTLDSIADVMSYQTASNFYGGLDSLYQIVHDPELIAYRQATDMLEFLSDDDPPFYLFSKNTADHPSDDVLHHWYHSRALYETALEANLSEVKADIKSYALNTTEGETGNAFILRHLSEANMPEALSIASLEEVQIYPNPTSTHFYVNLENEEIQKVEVLSLSGNVLKSQSSLSETAFVDVSSMTEGTYMVRITGTSTENAKRLVIR